MPTEEVFTMPDRLRADGVVFSTKPLALNGNIIENMKLEFVNGKYKKFTTDRGEEILRNFFEDDENSRYLGEVALVPFSSPINKSDVLFFNTLSCPSKTSSMSLPSVFDRSRIRRGKRSTHRSEERRVGKECRSRWSPYH